MTDDSDMGFIEYWDAVDQALLRYFGIHTGNAGIEAESIARAREEGQAPEDLALWWGDTYRLATPFAFRPRWGRS